MRAIILTIVLFSCGGECFSSDAVRTERSLAESVGELIEPCRETPRWTIDNVKPTLFVSYVMLRSNHPSNVTDFWIENFHVYTMLHWMRKIYELNDYQSLRNCYGLLAVYFERRNAGQDSHEAISEVFLHYLRGKGLVDSETFLDMLLPQQDAMLNHLSEMKVLADKLSGTDGMTMDVNLRLVDISGINDVGYILEEMEDLGLVE